VIPQWVILSNLNDTLGMSPLEMIAPLDKARFGKESSYPKAAAKF
jgi:hypothetical protein